MKATVKFSLLVIFLYFGKPAYSDSQCAGGISGSGLAAQNTVLFVWAKTVDDPSTFPSWANTLPSTFVNFYQVMSYNQHSITTKVATKNGEFFVADAGHDVIYYKNLYQQSPAGYDGPYGIFVEEMLVKVEAEYGAAYFDDVDAIMMMITDGGTGWYYPTGNYGGVGNLGVNYTTGNGKTFFSQSGGVNNEFAHGEKTSEWIICHEYGHFLGLLDLPKNFGTYSLMQNNKVNEADEGVTPLSVKDVMDLGWLDVNDGTRVQTVTANASVTLQPLRSSSGIVAAKVFPDPNSPSQYFLIAYHQRSTNPYDGTYPDDGLLVWQISGISYTDIECGVGLDPITYGFNKGAIPKR